MKTTPLKAIRQKCLDCSGNQPKEVRFCPCTDCPLFSHRLGRNPARQGIGRLSAQKTAPELGKITKEEVSE